jgi:hypothetical protein
MVYISVICQMNWITEELSTSNFGDQRLSQRLVKMVEQLSTAPASSVPEAIQNPSDTLAAYRFWGAKRVNDSNILAPHRASTLERIEGLPRVLAIQDTSEFDYTHHPSVEGLGYLESDKQRGIKYHPILITTPDGVPQGILQHNFWTRPFEEYGKKHHRHKTLIESKESQRWLDAVTYTSSQIPPETEIIHIADREADIYELFIMEREAHNRLLIRANHNRSLEDGSGTLFECLQQVQDCGEMTVDVAQRKEQPPRRAHLKLRYAPIHLAPPKKKQHLPSIELTAIEVYEPSPPKGAKPVRWVLLTDLEISSIEDVHTYVDYYSLRWLIERYFYTLKSGCKVEDLQLDSAQKLQNAIATYAIIAIRIMFLMYQSRTTPQQPCDSMLEPHEWMILHWLIHKKPPPQKPPTLEEVVLWIAKLGGFFARKSDGPPGVKTLWRGYKRLQDATQLYLITQSYGPPFVYKA